MSASSRRESHGSGDRLTLHRRPHLLVAHGEPIICEGLVGILGRAGNDVDVAGDLDEALAILDKREVDALVVSHRLPPDGCLALLDACEDPPPDGGIGRARRRHFEGGGTTQCPIRPDSTVPAAGLL